MSKTPEEILAFVVALSHLSAKHGIQLSMEGTLYLIDEQQEELNREVIRKGDFAYIAIPLI